MSPRGNSYERMERLAKGLYEPIPLVATGIHALDSALRGGIPRNKLAIIAARTSHGKTATAVRLAVNMAMSGRRVVVLWAEDEVLEFDLRAMAILTATPFLAVLEAYRAMKLETVWCRVPSWKRDEWQEKCSTEKLERPTPEQLAEIVKSEHEAVFLLDHIGEVYWGEGFKHELIGDGLRLIRAEAQRCRNLFIAMAQLNREWDRRKAASEVPDKVRPVLSDIENSGQIEQVARVCIIAEKAERRQGEEDVATGEYRYHVFKPVIATAICRWHEDLATPDNFETQGTEQESMHWTEQERTP